MFGAEFISKFKGVFVFGFGNGNEGVFGEILAGSVD